jgi:hypothetical protein
LGNYVELPIGKCAIGCKWVYKRKHISYVLVNKHKLRLATKDFAQKEGIDV